MDTHFSTCSGADTGFLGREGTFSVCSFWNVECLARTGDLKLARFYFEKTLGYANHLGLYAEEIGLNGQQLGNFPQAFSHIALVDVARDAGGRDGEGGGVRVPEVPRPRGRRRVRPS